jgi:hypothetical protein
MPEELRKSRHPVAFTVAGFSILYFAAELGDTAMFCIGIPALLICLYIGGGGRIPRKIPNRDALLYMGISVMLVIGAVLYNFLTTRK